MLSLLSVDIGKFLIDQKDVIQSILAIGTILVMGYGGLRLILRPIFNTLVFPVFEKIKSFITSAIEVPKKLDENMKILKDEVLPFISSFQYEFNKNSGKSLKDQITRIDDNVKLAELRSKLVSNMFLNVGVYECDTQGNTVWVNKALCELFGLSFEEMMNNGWLSAVDEQQRSDVWEQWHDNIKHGIPHESEFIVHNRKSNKTFKVRSTAMTHKANDGRVLGYYGNIIEI
jgi:PAS domain S-box-containing protein